MRWSIFFLAAGLFAISPMRLAAQENDPAARKEIPKWRTISISDSRLAAQEPRDSDELGNMVFRVAREAVEEEGGDKVAPEDFWLTVIDARDPWDPRMASYQGSEPVYPASVVKLCYMLAVYDQLYTHRLAMDEALREDLQKMIYVSDNKATNRILDRVTNTNFGEELSGEARESFEHKRGTVERYLATLGLTGLSPTNKTFDDDIRLYGRDVQWLGVPKWDNYSRSNMMTTDDTARLLYLLWRHAVVDDEACDEMLALMKRDEERRTYFSKVVPEGATLYSKDGFTGRTRHDVGIFELPEGGAIIIVAFSKPRGVTDNTYPQVIESAAEKVLKELRQGPGKLDQ